MGADVPYDPILNRYLSWKSDAASSRQNQYICAIKIAHAVCPKDGKLEAEAIPLYALHHFPCLGATGGVDTTLVWTAERILALAPDGSSAKAGRELATPRNWVTLGQSDGAIWGECQGSGSTPYKTEIELSEPAFKCNCPSRKFPCKHGLGLFLLFESPASSFPKNEPPIWVTDWLKSRAKRAEEAAVKKEQVTTGQVGISVLRPSHPAAQAKVAAQRQARVSAGIRDLQIWLGDLARDGLSAAQSRPYSFWEGPAARLVDAQAPGLARLVRSMAGVPASGEGWPDRLLEQMGKLHLLLESYERIESLPPETQADIRTMIGWTVSQDELLSSEGVNDRWAVLGQRAEDEDKLRVQRTWLWGASTRQAALVLDFAFGNQPLDRSLVPGTLVDAEVVYFPGAVPQRALVKKRNAATVGLSALQGMNIDRAIEGYAAALAHNPWLERFAVVLQDVVPRRDGQIWRAQDANSKTLPILPGFGKAWEILALSGGNPVTLFGEWNGAYLLPLSVWVDRLVHL